MNTAKIKNFLSLALDFLFPPEESVKTFENIGAEELLKLLPHSKSTSYTSPSSVVPASELGSRVPSLKEETVHSLFVYSDERVKHLVWEIKYYRNQKITDSVGFLLAQRILEVTKNDGKQFLLVPIPLTNRRIKERGFNHTELIAKSILKYLPNNFELAPNILKKIRHTPKQSSVEDREERFRNIVGVFAVPNPELVKDKNIIVIDDVTTTGATIAEARKVLVEAGARSVQAFVVAH